MRIDRVTCALALAGTILGAQAQTAPVAPASLAQPPLPSTTPRTIAALTPVVIAVEAEINSKTSRIGDTFPISLTTAVVNPAGEVLIPAGARGQGEVIHAAKARAMGKAGELILAARYLQCGATRIPLGHFKFGRVGLDNSKTVGATTSAVSGASALAGPVGIVAMVPLMFISGGNITVPVGTRADAKITADVAMTPEVTASCVVATKTEG